MSIDSYCLANPVEDLWLFEAFPFFLSRNYSLVHVTRLAVDHDDAEVALFISE